MQSWIESSHSSISIHSVPSIPVNPSGQEHSNPLSMFVHVALSLGGAPGILRKKVKCALTIVKIVKFFDIAVV